MLESKQGDAQALALLYLAVSSRLGLRLQGPLSLSLSLSFPNILTLTHYTHLVYLAVTSHLGLRGARREATAR